MERQLWSEKYRPTSLAKLDYHKSQAQHLKNLVQQGDFPHLLVYGPSGSGKKTRVICLLKELFGTGIERVRFETMNFQTPSNKKLEISLTSSNYHFEVVPGDVEIYDKIIIQELIKTAAQSHQLEASGQRDFKVVVISEADHLTKDAQHALRRTMEKYASACRIILLANSISQMIPAIRSRCLGVRVPAPTNEEIISILKNICRKEGLTLPTELAERITLESHRNLRRAVLICEACKVKEYPFRQDQKLPDVDWEIFLRDTAKMIVAEQTPKKLLEVRERIYELITHGITYEEIFKGLLKELVKNCDMQLKTEVVESAAIFEHRLHLGNKPIFHIEAFISKFMAIYKKFMEETMGDIF